MKASTNMNNIQEINTGKLKHQRIDNSNSINNNSKKISTEFGPDSPHKNNTNFHNYLGVSKSTNNNINDMNYAMNTSNTYDYNNVDPSIIKELKRICDNCEKLDLEIINSLTLPKGLLIQINALGMVSNSLRNANDGNTFFGFLLENDDVENNQKVDFLIKPKEENFEQRIIGRHFRIRFDVHKLCYFIKDLGCGYGTFMKISEETILKDSYLINIGNSYIVCTFGVDEFEIDGENILNAEKILNIKVFSENNQNEPYFFNPSQVKKIYIGRDIGCNIIVDDTLLSRIHCTIEFKNEKGWVIYDGRNDDTDFINNKPSTNGTWLYLIEETKIKDKMIFKSNQNVYECHIKEKEL